MSPLPQVRAAFRDGIQFDKDRKKAEELLALAERVDDCLISHLKPNKKGYIYVSIGRARRVRANRLIFSVYNGSLEDDDLVRHTCDTRNCIEPDHLVKGTPQDNSDDMVERGRQGGRGKPATDDEELRAALSLQQAGYSLSQIATIQNLAGASSAADRIRRAKLL